MNEDDDPLVRLEQVLNRLIRAQAWFSPTHPFWQEIEALRIITEEYLILKRTHMEEEQ